MEYSAAASNARPLALAQQHDLLRTASGDVHPAAYLSSGTSHPPDVSAALRLYDGIVTIVDLAGLYAQPRFTTGPLQFNVKSTCMIHFVVVANLLMLPIQFPKFSLLSTLQSSLYGTAHSQHACVCTPLTSKACGHYIASSLGTHSQCLPVLTSSR